ncbi:hypothetical protein GCM10017783_25330 [Deinococcus piscis]|uniref:Outer membrane efflux protein n=1 Tax=Deinococcus piscis TaxID=394230 RepID=A0ABQ3KG13_9DEIO|nr:TolC family protein [Deinococcus piscis]GHG12081.1 hypothetical protein GCM10017783_25330 [Deinococcus piscis]
MRNWGLVKKLGLTALVSGAAYAEPLNTWDALQAAPQNLTVQQRAQELQGAELELARLSRLELSALAEGTSVRSPTGSTVNDAAAGINAQFLGPQALGREGQRRLADVQRAQLALRAAHYTALEDLLDGWYALAEAEQAIRTAQAELQVAELEERRAQAQADAGVLNELDRRQVSLALEQAHHALQRANLSRSLAQSELLAQGVLDADPTADLAAWVPLPLPPADWQQPSAAVRQASLNLAAAQLRLNELEAQSGVRVQGQGQLSANHFALSASVDRELSGSAAAKATLRGTGDLSWNLGLSAAMPLNSRNSEQVALAQQAVTQAQKALAQAQERDTQARSLWRGQLAEAAQNTELAAQALAEAQDAEAVTQQRLNQGLISPSVLAQAQVVTRRAEAQLLTARKQQHQSALQGWRATGWLPPLTPQATESAPVSTPTGSTPVIGTPAEVSS